MTPPAGFEKVLRSISHAARRHDGQMRKDGVTPYAAHPLRVLLTVIGELGESDPDTLAAAALHDTIEDTLADFDELAAEFGEAVAGYVATLTKDNRLPEEEREERYLAALTAAPRPVKLIKIADTLDNLRDLARGGNTAKTVAKARELLQALAPDPTLARALDLLRATVEATGARR